jgi:uncharacterized oxidoreductase
VAIGVDAGAIRQAHPGKQNTDSIAMKPAQHVVLITGGATGIGFALAKKFHAAGNRVTIAGRSERALAAAAAALPGVTTCVADIAQSVGRERLLEAHPDITVLVNNAGIQVNGLIAELPRDDLERELNVNFLAPVMLCRDFLPLLLERDSAVIINISSGLALVPKQDAAMYCASKAALHSFSKALRWQLEGSRVKVFEVLPPAVDTAMNAGRGRGKISPSQAAEEFWHSFVADRYEINIGKTKLLAVLNRVSPFIAEKILRHGP